MIYPILTDLLSFVISENGFLESGLAKFLTPYNFLHLTAQRFSFSSGLLFLCLMSGLSRVLPFLEGALGLPLSGC
jgi:hypothetical protein